ncbi:FecR domain-containing protein [Thermodesulfobacteriota bacterium]
MTDPFCHHTLLSLTTTSIHIRSRLSFLLGLLLLSLISGPQFSHAESTGQASYVPATGILDLPSVTVDGQQHSWVLRENKTSKGRFTLIAETASNMDDADAAIYSKKTSSLAIPAVLSGNKILRLKLQGNPQDGFSLIQQEVIKTLAKPISAKTSGEPVGEVIFLEGLAYTKNGSSNIPLEKGSTIYQNNIIITEQESRVEIHFHDGTILAMDQNSRIVIDDYVFDTKRPDKSKLLLLMGKGAMRVISGKIAKINPERFHIKSPLATIGIRGTDVAVFTGPAGDQVFLLDISAGHSLTVADRRGNSRILGKSKSAVDLAPGKIISSVRALTKDELAEILDRTPVNTHADAGVQAESLIIDQIEYKSYMRRFTGSQEPAETHWIMFELPRKPEPEIKPADQKTTDPEKKVDRYKFDIESYKPLECFKCHDHYFEESIQKPYVHLPYLKKDCPICHVALDYRRALNIKPLDKYKFVVPQESPDSGNWQFSEYVQRDIIEELNIVEGEYIYLEAINENGQVQYQKIYLPEYENLWEIDTDPRPPKISDVKVEVHRDLLISATISWKTDKLTDSILQYGMQSFNQPPIKDTGLGYFHKVNLPALKADRQYQFSITAGDVFGGKTFSDVQVFTTGKSTRTAPISVGQAPLKVSNLFFRHGDRYVVNLTANQPVTLSLGYLDTKDWIIPPGHPKITTRSEMNIEICHNCHEYRDGHKVNTPPRNGMVIPKEYPTLLDGRTTCMSCHIGHSGSIKNRVRKASKKELCLGCHHGQKIFSNKK